MEDHITSESHLLIPVLMRLLSDEEVKEEVRRPISCGWYLSPSSTGSLLNVLLLPINHVQGKRVLVPPG